MAGHWNTHLELGTRLEPPSCLTSSHTVVAKIIPSSSMQSQYAERREAGAIEQSNGADGSIDNNFSLREQIGKFAEALVATRKEVQSVRSAVTRLENNFEHFKDGPDWDTCTNELAHACTEIKAWRDGFEAEHQQLIPTLKEEMKDAVSEQIESRLEKFGEGLRYVESQLPHLWKGLHNRDEQHAATAEKLRSNADQVVETEMREVLGGIKILEEQYTAVCETLKEQAGRFAAFSHYQECRHNEVWSALKDQASSHAAFMQSIEKNLEVERSERETRTLDFKTFHQAFDALTEQVGLRMQVFELSDFGDGARGHPQGDLTELRASVDDNNMRIAAFDQLAEDMKAMKITWASAHASLTEDMRELMGRLEEATPLQLAAQLTELRGNLTSEIMDRRQSVQVLASKLQRQDACLSSTLPQSVTFRQSVATPQPTDRSSKDDFHPRDNMVSDGGHGEQPPKEVGSGRLHIASFAEKFAAKTATATAQQTAKSQPSNQYTSTARAAMLAGSNQQSEEHLQEHLLAAFDSLNVNSMPKMLNRTSTPLNRSFSTLPGAPGVVPPPTIQVSRASTGSIGLQSSTIRMGISRQSSVASLGTPCTPQVPFGQSFSTPQLPSAQNCYRPQSGVLQASSQGSYQHQPQSGVLQASSQGSYRHPSASPIRMVSEPFNRS